MGVTTEAAELTGVPETEKVTDTVDETVLDELGEGYKDLVTTGLGEGEPDAVCEETREAEACEVGEMVALGVMSGEADMEKVLGRHTN